MRGDYRKTNQNYGRKTKNHRSIRLGFDEFSGMVIFLSKYTKDFLKTSVWISKADLALIKSLIEDGSEPAVSVSEFIRAAVHNEISDKLKRKECVKKYLESLEH